MHRSPKLERRYSGSSEVRVSRSIRNKRLMGKRKQTQHFLEGIEFMADAFFVFGMAPTSIQSNKPEILVAYPSTPVLYSEAEIDHLIQFCFPSGFQQIPVKKGDDSIILTEFPIYLNQNGNRSYVCCIHMRALPQTPPFFASSVTRNYPFCLCLVSQVPYLSSHFQFLTYLTMALSGKALSIKRSIPERSSRKGETYAKLEFDHNSPHIAVRPGMHAPIFLFDDLAFFFSLSVYHKLPSFTLSSGHQLTIQNSLTKTQCLAYPTLSVLFSYLSLDNILLLYTAMLLEFHVVFTSQNLWRVSLAVIAITTLLDPFHSPSTVLPLLPSREPYNSILQTPTPYVIGVNNAGSFAPDVLVNLDNDTVTTQEELPELPRRKELKHKINMILKDLGVTITPPPKFIHQIFGAPKINPEYENFISKLEPTSFPSSFLSIQNPPIILPSFVIDSILTLFSLHLAPILEQRVCECYVTDTTDPRDPVTVINKDLFLYRAPDDEREFMTHFAATVLFDDFCSRLADDYQSKKESLYNSETDSIRESLLVESSQLELSS